MVEVRPITDCGLPGCGAAVNWLPEPDDPSPNLVRGPGRRPKRSWFRGHIGAPCCVQARREVNMPMRRATGNCPATSYICCMCGRVIQSGGPLRYAIVDGMNVRDSRMHNYLPRWNAAPSQELLVIRRNHRTSEVSIDRSIHCAGGSFPTGARTRVVAASQVRDGAQFAHVPRRLPAAPLHRAGRRLLRMEGD
jgi:hypothetical protein